MSYLDCWSGSTWPSDLRWVDGGDFLAVAGWCPFVVDEQTERLFISDPVWSSDLLY